MYHNYRFKHLRNKIMTGLDVVWSQGGGNESLIIALDVWKLIRQESGPNSRTCLISFNWRPMPQAYLTSFITA